MVEPEKEPQGLMVGTVEETKEEKKQLAALEEQISDNNFPTISVALVLAIFSTLTIFILKKKVKTS